MSLDGTELTCLTCGQAGNNDGARWRPVSGDAILFVSNRDHPYAIGGDGAGFGQELYAMRPDGSHPTRLTTSDPWATNYHANWSPDGKRIVWGTTQNRTWDVMVADFVSDSPGMRLAPGAADRARHDVVGDARVHRRWRLDPHDEHARRVPLDGHLLDRSRHGRAQAAHDQPHVGRARAPLARRAQDRVDLEAVAARGRVRADDRRHLAHLRLSLGRARHLLRVPRPARRLLERADADGRRRHERPAAHDRRIVVADNQWSSDGTKIIFRQSDANAGTSKIRLLTFDDCK